MASSSSTTGVLSQIYLLFSCFRAPDVSHFSIPFQVMDRFFSSSARKPEGVWIRKRKVTPLSNLKSSDRANFIQFRDEQNAAELKENEEILVWGIDAAKTEGAVENEILLDLGKSMERMLTMPREEFLASLSKYSKEKSSISSDTLEAFVYSKLGSFLFRSQLDAQSSELLAQPFQDILEASAKAAGEDFKPRKIYDLKTRAVNPIRYNMENYENYLDYKITKLRGLFNSFEREWYDMARSGFLKYSYQLRMGNMAGALVTYHNTKETFGFEFISLPQIDKILYGSTAFGEVAFRRSIEIFGKTLDWIFGYNGDANKCPFAELYNSDYSVRVTCAVSPTDNLIYFYVDRAITEEDFYTEKQIRSDYNEIVSVEEKAKIAYEVVSDALNQITKSQADSFDKIEMKEPSEKKDGGYLKNFFNKISSLFAPSSPVNKEDDTIALRIHRLNIIKKMRPHLFVDFLNEQDLAKICASLKMNVNQKEQMISSLENFLLEFMPMMSKLEAQSLAFCNRLQVYALCIENKLNGNVVNTPFKYDLGDKLETNISLSLISPLPFKFMKSDLLNDIASDYHYRLQQSALNERIRLPSQHQPTKSRKEDSPVLEYAKELNKYKPSKYKTRIHDAPKENSETFEERLCAFKPELNSSNIRYRFDAVSYLVRKLRSVYEKLAKKPKVNSGLNLDSFTPDEQLIKESYVLRKSYNQFLKGTSKRNFSTTSRNETTNEVRKNVDFMLHSLYGKEEHLKMQQFSYSFIFKPNGSNILHKIVKIRDLFESWYPVSHRVKCDELKDVKVVTVETPDVSIDSTVQTCQIVCNKSTAVEQAVSLYRHRSWFDNIVLLSNLYLFTTRSRQYSNLTSNLMVVGLTPFLQRFTNASSLNMRSKNAEKYEISYVFKPELYGVSMVEKKVKDL